MAKTIRTGLPGCKDTHKGVEIASISQDGYGFHSKPFVSNAAEIGGEHMNDIPTYVQNVLDNWETLAFVAYDGYEKAGRLVVGIERDEMNPAGARLLSVVYDFETGKPDPATAKLLAAYDPDTEIIIQFIDNGGHVRRQRLRTGPGARHPKRVFFFEMLRRIDEEPDSIDLRDLPHWLVEVLENLEAAQKPA